MPLKNDATGENYYYFFFLPIDFLKNHLQLVVLQDDKGYMLKPLTKVSYRLLSLTKFSHTGLLW